MQPQSVGLCCRVWFFKIFNADWIIDGEQQPKSLFKMIKNTFEKTPDYVLSAYKDNAAVMEGSEVGRYFADHQTGRYDFHQEPAHILMKVETHNPVSYTHLDVYKRQPVHLELWVKVKSGWADDERALRSLGYVDDL